jgi:hypothetical protein
MPESTDMMSADSMPVDSTPPQLNVIFHGPFLFIYYPDRVVNSKIIRGRVEAVTPDTPEHVAVAGTWLGEKLCHPGTFYLTGIKTDQDKFDPADPKKLDPTMHAIIDARTVGIDISKSSYYRFILPLPSYENVLAKADISKFQIFVGDHASRITANYFGTVHVLSYKIKKDFDQANKYVDTPQLEGLQWGPEPSPYGHWEWYCDNNKAQSRIVTPYKFATNLHIYAEAAFEPDPNHPIRDFNQMVAMLPGLKLGLAQRFPDDLEFPDPVDCDDLGIVREEQGGLRGLPPPDHPPFRPPLICDAPSLVVIGAQDAVP